MTELAKRDWKAVVFDMDGVLFDSESHWVELERDFMESQIPGWKNKAHPELVGHSVENLYQILAKDYHLKISREDFLKSYDEIAKEIYLKRTKLFGDTLETLAGLRLMVPKLGLASSSRRHWVEMGISQFKVKSFFDEVVSADDVGGEGKPSPKVYLECLARLGVSASQAFAIEDSTNGITAAKKAGMVCLGYQNGMNQNQRMSHADRVINRLSDILGFFRTTY